MNANASIDAMSDGSDAKVNFLATEALCAADGTVANTNVSIDASPVNLDAKTKLLDAEALRGDCIKLGGGDWCSYN